MPSVVCGVGWQQWNVLVVKGSVADDVEIALVGVSGSGTMMISGNKIKRH